MKIPNLTFVLLLTIISSDARWPPENWITFRHFRDKDGQHRRGRFTAEVSVPVSVMMAFMHQESRFVAGAKPPRKQIWGFIPGPRPSDAYGYSQAKNSTWEWYKTKSGNHGADRDDFDDAIDFVGSTTTQLTRPMALRKTTPSDCTSRTTRGMAVQTRYLPI